MLGDIPNPLIGVYEHCEKLPREKGLKMFLDFVGNSPVETLCAIRLPDFEI